MDLALTEFQSLLQDAARAFFQREVTLETLKAIDAAEHRHHTGLWAQFAANGWQGLLLPESAGGVAASALDLGVLLEEFGRAAVNTPFRHSTGAAAIVAAANPSPERDALLAGLASGEQIAAVALQEPGQDYRAYGVTTSAAADAVGYRLTGRKAVVPHAAAAHRLVVLTRVEGTAAAFIVDPAAGGVAMSRRNSIGGEPLYDIEFDATLPAAARLTFEGDPGQALSRQIDLMVLMNCAETVGVMAEMLRATAAHVTTRVQFGRPIGTFQAVHMRISDLATLVEGCRLATFEALDAWDRRDRWNEKTAVAKAMISAAAVPASLDAHLLHGGIGLTTESLLPYYSRKAKANQMSMGTQDDHLAALADLVLGGRAHA